MLRAPEPLRGARVLLVESTYGDRRHPADPLRALADEINRVADTGGVVVIPTFAIGRAQEVIWHLRHLEDQQLIPELPVFLDSPMAIDATEMFCRFPEEHNLEMAALMDEHRCPLCCRRSTLVRTAEQSRRLGHHRGPMIVLAGSGMATGGRVVHHLARLLPDDRNTVLFVGYQASGTRGRRLVDGAQEVWIDGGSVPVRSRVTTIGGLSAHADADEIVGWLSTWKEVPATTYVVHGEPASSAALAARLREDLGWSATAAEEGVSVEL